MLMTRAHILLLRRRSLRRAYMGMLVIILRLLYLSGFVRYMYVCVIKNDVYGCVPGQKRIIYILLLFNPKYVSASSGRRPRAKPVFRGVTYILA